MRLKNNTVRVHDLHRKVVMVMFKIDDPLRKFLGYEPTITSAIDGKHKRSSAHNTGRAFDLRTWTTINSGVQIPPTRRLQMYDLINKLVDDEFDVVTESDHIHVEYDPKVPT